MPLSPTIQIATPGPNTEDKPVIDSCRFPPAERHLSRSTTEPSLDRSLELPSFNSTLTMSTPFLPRRAAAIPSITGLRLALDYGDSQLARCSAFYDDIRAFRKKFVTSSGRPGPSLYDWLDRDHQDGRNEMTEAYLNQSGLLFWPDDLAAVNHNKLEYTKDKQRYVVSSYPLVANYLQSVFGESSVLSTSIFFV